MLTPATPTEPLSLLHHLDLVSVDLSLSEGVRGGSLKLRKSLMTMRSLQVVLVLKISRRMGFGRRQVLVVHDDDVGLLLLLLFRSWRPNNVACVDD